MATFGISLYGRSKYGPDVSVLVDYSVGPLTADALDYETIRLKWKSPTGDWSAFRLIKNWHGFASTENDGEILLDSTVPASGYTDRNVTPGRWHYYSIWVNSANGWQPSADVCTLMLEEHSYGARLFDSLPLHHRLSQGVADNLPPVDNEDLRKFLLVLAMGFDYAKTYYDTLLFLNDPMRNRLSQLLALAHQFGITFSPAAPGGQFRKRVLNAGVLAREKGTLEGTRNALRLMTGWDVDLVLGPNLMLSEDPASFIHPEYPSWDPGINYPAVSRVTYNGYLYEATAGGALGQAQAPSGTASSNTWWTHRASTVDTTLVAADGSVAGWAPVSFTGGVPPDNKVAVGVGVQSATDSSVNHSNTLAIQNTSGVTASLGARSAGDLTDQTKAIRRAVPVPRPVPWASTVEYKPGDVVSRDGRVYVAAKESVGSAPAAANSKWTLVSTTDGRQIFTASTHAKGQTAGAQGRTFYPLVDILDDHGAVIASIDTSADTSFSVYDSFRSNSAGVVSSLAAAPVDAGSGSWSVNGTVNESGGEGAFALADGLALIAGTANASVAVTFDSQAANRVQALVMRASGNTTYLRATRSALYSVNLGTPTLIGNYSRAFADGERITAVLNGSNITVNNGGDVVLAATSAFNSTASLHGIMVL